MCVCVCARALACAQDAEVVRNYTSMASKIMSSVNLEETEPLVAKIIGDQYSRLGQVSIAEQWFDRALQRRGKVEAHDVVRLCFEMAVVREFTVALSLREAIGMLCCGVAWCGADGGACVQTAARAWQRVPGRVPVPTAGCGALLPLQQRDCG